jgi:hypothetical protein
VACHNPVISDDPQDCATVSGANWRIGPYPTSSESDIRVEIGGSRALFLDPFVEAECVDSVVSATWSVEDPSVATVVPEETAHRGGWVNGLAAGTTTVRARIAFSDGSAQTASRAIQVVASGPPAGTVVVAEGTVDLEPYNGSSSSDFRRFVPFALPADASQVDIRVDWTSPLNNVTVGLSKGKCSGPASASCADGLRFIAASNTNNVKPVTLSVVNLAAGNYTLMIDNLGPGPETTRFEVRLPPS